jgi:hypothetical protein
VKSHHTTFNLSLLFLFISLRVLLPAAKLSTHLPAQNCLQMFPPGNFSVCCVSRQSNGQSLSLVQMFKSCSLFPRALRIYRTSFVPRLQELTTEPHSDSLQSSTQINGASGSVVGWGTMLQVGKSRFRFPMSSLDFLNLSAPSSLTTALESTQPLTEMSTRNLPGSKGRAARKVHNLTAICEPIV